MGKIAKTSEAVFGEPYRKRANKKHESFMCCECGKNRHTHPIYYPISDETHLLCADCYRRLLLCAQRTAEEMAETLPAGETIYMGKKAHRCNADGGREFEERFYNLIVKGQRPARVILYRCKKCGQLIIKGIKVDPRLFGNYNIVSSSQTEREKKKALLKSWRVPQQSRQSYRTMAATDFLTRTSINKCSGANHDIDDIEVGVKVLHGDYSVTTEIVPAVYCRTCNKYYLLESDYQGLMKKGILLCNVVEQSYWVLSHKNEFYITNNESLLYKMGYSVSTSNNLSADERCTILRTALENNLMTKGEMLSHLDYLIRRSEGQEALLQAVEKWKQDRKYLRGLINDPRAYFEAKTIIHMRPQKRRN